MKTITVPRTINNFDNDIYDPLTYHYSEDKTLMLKDFRSKIEHQIQKKQKIIEQKVNYVSMCSQRSSVFELNSKQ